MMVMGVVSGVRVLVWVTRLDQEGGLGFRVSGLGFRILG